MLKPLGLSVTGAGCDVMVPGGGVIDLQGIADPGQEVDLGEVSVTGAQAAALMDGVVLEVPGLTDRLYVGGSAILHMDIGDDVAAQVLDAGSGDAQGQTFLGDAIRQALDVPSGDMADLPRPTRPTATEAEKAGKAGYWANR